MVFAFAGVPNVANALPKLKVNITATASEVTLAGMAGVESVFAVDFAGGFRVKVAISRQQKRARCGAPGGYSCVHFVLKNQLFTFLFQNRDIFQ